MRILYVAKHNSGGNDDEGAIADALHQLGHRVTCVPEQYGNRAGGHGMECDLCLFHKWYDVRSLARVKCPKVFWYFDLVSWPDRTLEGRCRTRVQWMNDVVPHADLGFCTDGDWVANDHTGKLVWLPQGADGRVTGRGTRDGGRAKPLLFVGGVKNTGSERNSWFNNLVSRYGPQLTHYSQGVYGRELADVIGSHLIMLAPDAPVTGRYWSNRVYNALGFGAFLLHPYCEELTRHYVGGRDLLYYHSREEMYALIDKYLPDVEYRHGVAEQGLATTLGKHLYLHRCTELLRVVKERLGVG